VVPAERLGLSVSGRVLRSVGAVACALAGDTMLYAVLPGNPGAFGVSPAQVGILLSANRFVRLASNSLAGWVYLRFGLTLPFAAGAGLAVLATLTYGLGQGFGLLLGARLLWGVCYSLLRLGGQLVALEESRRENRAQVLGWFTGGQRLGSLTATLAGGALFDLLGRGGGFAVAGAVGLLGAPLALTVGEGRTPSRAPALAEGPVPAPPASGGRASWLGAVLGLGAGGSPGAVGRLLAVSGVAFGLFFAVSGVLTATLGYYLRLRVGPGMGVGVATLTGLALAPGWLFYLMGPYLGRLADRLGRARVAGVAVPAVAGGLAGLALSPSVVLSLAVLPLVFLAGTLALVSLDALAGDLAPRPRRPQVMGRYATWQDLGSALGPLAGYSFLGWVPLEAVYLLTAGLLALFLLLFLWAFASEVRPPLHIR